MSATPLEAFAWSEERFVDEVLKIAKRHGWLRHHVRPARTAKGYRTPVQGETGFPDLVLARAGEVIVAECKSERGRPEPEQREWLAALNGSGAEVYLWRPRHLAAIEDRLRRTAR